MNQPMPAPRMETLSARHHALDRRICAEQGRMGSDDLSIVGLKREKLRLRDAMAGIR